jgi:hypothetical protein
MAFKVGILLIFLTFALLFAHDAIAAQWTFVSGQPSIVDDGEATASDNPQQSRWMFVSGQPAIVFDSTASFVAPASTAGQSEFWF